MLASFTRTAIRAGFMVAAAAGTLGAQSPDSNAQPRAEARDTAVLVVQNRRVHVFRGPIGARSAAERAADALRRIREVADAGVEDSLVAQPVPQGVLIAAGSRGIFTIIPADLDTETNETLEDLTRVTLRRLGVAMVAEREQRSFTFLLKAIGFSMLATLVAILFLRGVFVLHRFTLEHMPRVAGARVPRLHVGDFTLLDANQILAFLRRVVGISLWGVAIFGAYLWLTYVLTRFPYSQPWGEALGAYLIATIKSLALAAVGAIPGLFTVVIIYFATRFLTRLVTTFFVAVEHGHVMVPWVHADTAQPTRRLLNLVLWLFALVVAYPYLPGSGSDVFKGMSVFVGIVLSIGSSGVISQAMSGLVLMYSRALKPGDYVRVGDTEGTVAELGMLSTKIRTNKDEEVTLPNSVVVGVTTKNYSRLATERGVVLYTSVSIRYDVPWRQVHALLFAAASRTGGLQTSEPPFVLQVALGDWHVEYQLNVRLTEPHRRNRVLSELHANIQDVFYENGIDLLSPHFEGNHEHPPIASISRERWFDGRVAAPGPENEPSGIVIKP